MSTQNGVNLINSGIPIKWVRFIWPQMLRHVDNNDYYYCGDGDNGVGGDNDGPLMKVVL